MQLAIAGIDPERVSVVLEDSCLTVAAESDKTEEGVKETYPVFIKQGIADRSFKVAYRLPEHTEVLSAEVQHGVLTIELKREVPEKQVGKKIPIKLSQAAVPKTSEKK